MNRPTAVHHNTAPPGPAPRNLPGWRTEWSSEHQRFYYIDIKSGKSQWETPLLPALTAPKPYIQRKPVTVRKPVPSTAGQSAIQTPQQYQAHTAGQVQAQPQPQGQAQFQAQIQPQPQRPEATVQDQASQPSIQNTSLNPVNYPGQSARPQSQIFGQSTPPSAPYYPVPSSHTQPHGYPQANFQGAPIQVQYQGVPPQSMQYYPPPPIQSQPKLVQPPPPPPRKASNPVQYYPPPQTYPTPPPQTQQQAQYAPSPYQPIYSQPQNSQLAPRHQASNPVLQNPVPSPQPPQQGRPQIVDAFRSLSVQHQSSSPPSAPFHHESTVAPNDSTVQSYPVQSQSQPVEPQLQKTVPSPTPTPPHLQQPTVPPIQHLAVSHDSTALPPQPQLHNEEPQLPGPGASASPVVESPYQPTQPPQLLQEQSSLSEFSYLAQKNSTAQDPAVQPLQPQSGVPLVTSVENPSLIDTQHQPTPPPQSPQQQLPSQESNLLAENASIQEERSVPLSRTEPLASVSIDSQYESDPTPPVESQNQSTLPPPVQPAIAPSGILLETQSFPAASSQVQLEDPQASGTLASQPQPLSSNFQPTPPPQHVTSSGQFVTATQNPPAAFDQNYPIPVSFYPPTPAPAFIPTSHEDNLPEVVVEPIQHHQVYQQPVSSQPQYYSPTPAPQSYPTQQYSSPPIPSPDQYQQQRTFSPQVDNQAPKYYVPPQPQQPPNLVNLTNRPVPPRPRPQSYAPPLNHAAPQSWQGQGIPPTSHLPPQPGLERTFTQPNTRPPPPQHTATSPPSLPPPAHSQTWQTSFGQPHLIPEPKKRPSSMIGKVSTTFGKLKKSVGPGSTASPLVKWGGRAALGLGAVGALAIGVDAVSDGVGMFDGGGGSDIGGDGIFNGGGGSEGGGMFEGGGGGEDMQSVADAQTDVDASAAQLAMEQQGRDNALMLLDPVGTEYEMVTETGSAGLI